MNFHCAYREAVLTEKHKSSDTVLMFLLTSSDWTDEGWIDFPFILFCIWFFIVYTYLFTLLYSFQSRWNKEIKWLAWYLRKIGKTRAYFK